MFYLKPDKKTVVDAYDKVVGELNSGRFLQQPDKCHRDYAQGLQPFELERLAEFVQQNSRKR